MVSYVPFGYGGRFVLVGKKKRCPPYATELSGYTSAPIALGENGRQLFLSMC